MQCHCDACDASSEPVGLPGPALRGQRLGRARGSGLVCRSNVRCRHSRPGRAWRPGAQARCTAPADPSLVRVVAACAQPCLAARAPAPARVDRGVVFDHDRLRCIRRGPGLARPPRPALVVRPARSAACRLSRCEPQGASVCAIFVPEVRMHRRVVAAAPPLTLTTPGRQTTNVLGLAGAYSTGDPALKVGPAQAVRAHACALE